MLFVKKRETKAVMEDLSAKTPIKAATFAAVGETDIAPSVTSVPLACNPVSGAFGSETKKAAMK
ncbi:MAG: hypothetical protein AAGA72_11375 [Pseudomonadota bacterium]